MFGWNLVSIIMNSVCIRAVQIVLLIEAVAIREYHWREQVYYVQQCLVNGPCQSSILVKAGTQGFPVEHCSELSL